MADVLKVREILTESEKSLDDSATQAVKRASETLHGIESIYFEAKVEEASS